jgi:indole-3-glycerol phosphate synthase
LEKCAFELEMSVLIEIHDEAELQRASNLRSKLLGINNRNLKTLKTDINTCIDLAKHISPDKIIIAESGIKTAKEVQFIKNHGINNFLIGESLLREANIGVALGRLLDF